MESNGIESNRIESNQLDFYSAQANLSAPIIRRANYVSGRDQKSVKAFSDLLSTLTNARTKPEEVARVRDPVLSDGYFKDVSGRCWRQSLEGDPTAKMLLRSIVGDRGLTLWLT